MTTQDFVESDRIDFEREEAEAHVHQWRRRRDALWLFAALTLLAGLTGTVALLISGSVAGAFFAVAGTAMQTYLFVVVARICATLSQGSGRL